MQSMILVLHVIIAAILVGAVLVQRSEGGALGLGGGGTGGLISGRGAADMMVNITSWVGGLFFVTSILLAVLASQRPADRSLISDKPGKPVISMPLPAPPVAAPVAPTTAAPSTPAPAEQSAPTPAKAETRAGPLEEIQAAPAKGAVKAAPAPVGAVTKSTAAPVAAAPKAPVGATKSAVGAPAAAKGPAAPMIPLSEGGPASAPESAQGAGPAPKEKQRSGPDE